MTFDVGPSAKPQRLHRDDKDFHVNHEDQASSGYRFGSDVMMAFMIPGMKTTVENKRRILHGMFFTCGYHRQEENAYLANSPEEVLAWSPAAQRAMGYELSSPNIGFVEFKTPLQYMWGVDVDTFGRL